MHQAPRSNRVLSVFNLVMINVIAIDSLRNLPTNAAAGLSIIGFYLIAGIAFLLPCILITAELATHYPKRGGVYVWVREAFGVKWGFVTVWLQWIYNVNWYPTILIFIATNVAYLISPHLAQQKIYMLSMVIGLFLLASIANAYGMKLSSALSSFSAVVGTIVPMIIMIGLGIHWLLAGKPLAIHPSLHAFLPHIENNNNLALLSIVMFSLMGIEMSAVHAQEVKNPGKDYPKALKYSGFIITATLILATLAIALVVPSKSLNIYSGMDQAFSLFLNASHLHWLLPIVIVMIIIGSFGGMAAWVIGPTKALMVCAQDGALPSVLAKTNHHGAPVNILILQFLLVVAFCGLFMFYKNISTVYWILSDITAILALLFYILFFAAAIKLRYKTPPRPQTYRIPGYNNSGMWIAGTVGIAICVVVTALSFIPPSSIPVGNKVVYEALLIGGTVLFTVIPLCICKYKKIL